VGLLPAPLAISSHSGSIPLAGLQPPTGAVELRARRGPSLAAPRIVAKPSWTAVDGMRAVDGVMDGGGRRHGRRWTACGRWTASWASAGGIMDDGGRGHGQYL
jgi:hypothetical protein